MTNRKKKNIIAIIVLVLIVLTFLSNSIYAATDLELGDLQNYKSEAQMGAAKDKAQIILGIIQTVGVVGSVIALIAIGIKYMMGSVEQKAEYKKTLIPYIIGAFLVFTASLLPQIIYNLLADFH